MTIETTSALTDVQFPGYALESLPDTETHAQESRNSRESQTALRNAPKFQGPRANVCLKRAGKAAAATAKIEKRGAPEAAEGRDSASGQCELETEMDTTVDIAETHEKQINRKTHNKPAAGAA